MTKPRFQDLACPRCGHRSDFHIDVTATAYVDASGPTVESDYHWDGRSCCTCLGSLGCGFDEASCARGFRAHDETGSCRLKPAR